ncbi:Pheromone receptor Rcb2 B44 [Mycena indigotica]|uniref:Pheromone receptor Rcb2 B44 n=1 Tax=Mycena indigotica TaxID=2126181 RepID=A0A8H6WGQ4_9AGAR|nr:Pheromone receptor Rcb2 B44 [Mycena indigotica]KAF7316126.1 Pheromone receptor Rcb2 B44 [Mycena indigotica]
MIEFGIPTAALAVNRRLYVIFRIPPSKSQLLQSPARRRNMILVDLAICLLPLVPYIALPFAAQVNSPRRFDILATVGCIPAFEDNRPNYVMRYGVQGLVIFAALGYGLLSAKAAARGGASPRIFINDAAAQHRDLSFWRYVRTTIFASGGLIACVLPSTCLAVAALPTLAAVAGVRHGQVKLEDWTASFTAQTSVEFARWSMGPVYALFAFALLGTGKDAWLCYSRLYSAMRFPRRSSSTTVGVSNIELPTIPGLSIPPKVQYGTSRPLSLSGPSTTIFVGDLGRKVPEFRSSLGTYSSHDESEYNVSSNSSMESGKFGHGREKDVAVLDWREKNFPERAESPIGGPTMLPTVLPLRITRTGRVGANHPQQIPAALVGRKIA